MNRTITEPYSVGLAADRQGEFFHRHILGVYDLYARLGAAFPDILFESCASGGGRFDPGMLAFAPQAWTSDDTDAVERLKIQWGTSLAYPLSSMAAHVAAVPNHQTGRITPLATRAAVAFFGVFGYELDPTEMTAEERRAVAEPGRVLQGPPRALPARPVRPAAQPVRGRREPGGLGGRRARWVAGDRRLLPGPQPARARRRSAAAARAGPGPDLSRRRLARRRRAAVPGQRRPSRRRRAHAASGCPCSPSATRPPTGATSARGCSSSRRSRLRSHRRRRGRSRSSIGSSRRSCPVESRQRIGRVAARRRCRGADARSLPRARHSLSVDLWVVSIKRN